MRRFAQIPVAPKKGKSQMSKTVVWIAIIVAIAAVGIYAFTRPEPTPKERLAEATDDIREATQEAVEAASDAAADAGEALANSATEAVDEMKAEVTEAYADVAERMAQTSQETQVQLTRFLADWEASGIMTEEGIDFTRATEAVEASDLSAKAKANVIAVLTALRNAPGAFAEKLDALKTLLKT